MRFSIITPSFRSSKWLRLCIASVADQQVDFEHIVQDGGSDDGTLDWLLQDVRVKAFVERDRGMYDAINRGLRRAKGEILAYLNCDEQYLPSALQGVSDCFDRYPEIDVLFADAIVVDGDGSYLCHRSCTLPLRHHTLVSGNLAVLTCSTFFRRSVIDRHRLFFNPDRRTVSDAEWVLGLIDRKVPARVVRSFTSAFAETGGNLSQLPDGVRERAELRNSAPAWARRLRALIVLHHRLRRLCAGHYWQKPFRYSIYTSRSPEHRQEFEVARPTFRWIRS